MEYQVQLSQYLVNMKLINLWHYCCINTNINNRSKKYYIKIRINIDLFISFLKYFMLLDTVGFFKNVAMEQRYSKFQF